jgi:hypothetical protein
VAAAIAAALALWAGPSAGAADAPGDSRAIGVRYPLFARLADRQFGAMTVNRVYLGVSAVGEVGRDSSGSGTIGGGYWPRNSNNQYLFNSGPRVAGIIGGSRPANPWAGDTTGALFFDASGLRDHGTAIGGILNARDPVDLASWPEAAMVPTGDTDIDYFPRPGFEQRPSRSEGDLWWLAWDGDPARNGARPHPLGVLAEFRVMAWNSPNYNADIVYLVVTYYNITSTDQADYAGQRTAIRPVLLEQAERFQELNETEFAVDLPDDGYTIEEFHAGFAADADVSSSAGTNHTSVNLPFALGYAWHADFPRRAEWSYPAESFGPPFFPGTGLVGTQFLRAPDGTSRIHLYSQFTGGGPFPDPNSAVRLFKQLSGAVSPADGFACNQGPPAESHICYIGNATPADVRYMQSTPAVNLEPGGSATVVQAYLFAAPVQLPGYTQGTRVLPGDPTRLSNATLLVQGANRIDSIAGFSGYTDDNGDGVVQPSEIRTVRGSLLGKAQLAQAVFEARFALPEPPASPDFFLIPGDAKVTVIWRTSATEMEGDPFFAVAGQAATVPVGGGAPRPNPLFDPNYRQFDVEGYRIYRGRVQSPAAMELIAQYDYAGTVFRDYTGTVMRYGSPVRGRCAPELGVTDDCPGVFDPPVEGQAPTSHVDNQIGGTFTQVGPGDRSILASGDVVVLRADTLVTGGGSGLPELWDTGVPFAHVDDEVRNGVGYFYAVVAFDVNAVASTGHGRTSLESVRAPKQVVPSRQASNLVSESVVTTGVFGRHGLLDSTLTVPELDPTTGKFAGPFPPTNAVDLRLVAFVAEVLRDPGEVSLTMDSVAVTGFEAATTVDAVYHYTVTAPAGSSRLSIPVRLSSTNVSMTETGGFPALVVDPAVVATHGGAAGGYGFDANYSVRYPAAYYTTLKVRGCVNGASGFFSFGSLCDANGPRWFTGTDNATMIDDPNGANPSRFRTGTPRTSFNNVGGPLPRVRTIFEPQAYNDYSQSFRDVHAVLSPFASAVDYRVHWGNNATIDSVIDVVHDVVVPFSPRLGATWGILNQAATQNGASYYDQRAELTVSDIGCVEPLRTLDPGGIACSGPTAALARHADPGPIAFGSSGSTTVDRTTPASSREGFVLYLKGHAFMVELEGTLAPAPGTVWTMRDYVGAINGGVQAAGDGGPQSFNAVGMARPFSAVGSRVGLRYEVTNELRATSSAALAEVHPVPDPYYANGAGPAAAPAEISFVNLPAEATIRIYSTSGRLIRVLVHGDDPPTGSAAWNLRDRDNKRVTAGVFFYHVSTPDGAEAVGRMTVVGP